MGIFVKEHYKQRRKDFVNLRMKYVPNEMPFIHLMDKAEEVQESHNVTDWSAEEIIAFIEARLDQSKPLAFVGDDKGFVEKAIADPLARYVTDLKAGKRYAIVNSVLGGLIIVFIAFGVIVLMAPDNEITMSKALAQAQELQEKKNVRLAKKGKAQ
jgi:hypothetical protein